MDVSEPLKAKKQFEHPIQQLGNTSLVIVSAGMGHRHPALDPWCELETINTNISGFTVISGVAFHHFKKIQKGHLVGISFVATLRGSAGAPAYSASKAYMSNDMERGAFKSIERKT